MNYFALGVLLIVCILSYIGYMIMKGMCYNTRKDGVILTLLKNLLNSITLGIYGIIGFFQMKKEATA